MTDRTKQDYIKNFPRQWLQRWLVQLRKLRGSLTFLHTKCGLNARYTNVYPAPDPEDYDLEKTMRMMCGMAEFMEEDEFVDFGSDRLSEFYRFYKAHGKEFCKQFKRNKNQQTKQLNDEPKRH